MLSFFFSLLPLLLAFWRTSLMAAAAIDTADVSYSFSRHDIELAPQSSIRGRQVLGYVSDGMPLSLACVEAVEGRRTVYTPSEGASVHSTDGDGDCGWHAVRGGMQVCVGRATTPEMKDLKARVVTYAIQHAIGGSAIDPRELDTPLSGDQLARGRSLRMTELDNAEGESIPEPPGGERTYKWFAACAHQKVESSWLDITWFGLLSESLELNIMVWEPSGDKQEVQPYSAGNTTGLFLHGDENRWVHLLYRRQADGWAARAGIAEGGGGHVQHNHFDRLELGAVATDRFERAIVRGKEQLRGATVPSSGALLPGRSAEVCKKPTGGGLVTGKKRPKTASGVKKGGSLLPGGSAGGKKKPKGGGRADGKIRLKMASGAGAGDSLLLAGIGGGSKNPKKGGLAARKKLPKVGSGVGASSGALPPRRRTGFSKKLKGSGRVLKSAAGASRKTLTVTGGRKAAGGDGSEDPADDSEDPVSGYTSDGHIGVGGINYLRTTGCFASLTKNAKKLKKDLKNIPEENYKRAFLLSNKRKALGLKLLAKAKKEKKRQQRAESTDESDSESESEEEDEDVQWSERGIHHFKKTEAYNKRHQRSPERELSLSASALQRLPSLDDFVNTLSLGNGKFSLGEVVLPCFDMNFPREAVELIVAKTNKYVNLCTEESEDELDGHLEEEERKPKRAPHQKRKTRSLGRMVLPDPAFEEKHIYGMLGIMITMGLTKKTRMRKHWSTERHHDYPIVRECMQRDLFEMLYCRFLHCSDGNAPPRKLESGEDNPDFDSKWHIRLLEVILNKAWTGNVELNQWISYDEQMVKTSSTYARFVMRFNRSKPITHGIKIWSACGVEGYSMVGSVDGGMTGDPNLRPWFNCPLGRTTRQVLWVLLGACKEFADKVNGSGVYIAFDNFFTSPTLFECLAAHGIFAVGTCRVDRTAGAVPFWDSLDRKVGERGSMIFARSGEMSFVQFKDSKDVLICSTIHIAQPSGDPTEDDDEDHFKPVPYMRRAAGQDGKALELEQPKARVDYVANMGGVDTADQQNGSNTHDHKSCANYWRRVIEQKCEQSFTNGFLVFNKWIAVLKTEALGRPDEFSKDGKYPNILPELERLSNIERAAWDEVMATALMARCNVGSINKGGRRAAPTFRRKVWGSVKVKGARLCTHPQCKKRSTQGCDCKEFCTDKDSIESGVLMCRSCFGDPVLHEQAATAFWDRDELGLRRVPPMMWLP